jgi:peptidyl-tRNA hydrolase
MLSRPDLAVRMWAAGAHGGAPVLEDLHVTDARVGCQLRVLLGPDPDDLLDGILRELA